MLESIRRIQKHKENPFICKRLDLLQARPDGMILSGFPLRSVVTVGEKTEGVMISPVLKGIVCVLELAVLVKSLGSGALQ